MFSKVRNREARGAALTDGRRLRHRSEMQQFTDRSPTWSLDDTSFPESLTSSKTRERRSILVGRGLCE